MDKFVIKDFIEDVRFDRLGVFMYSHEDDTHAFQVMEDTIPKNVKEDRYKEIMMIQQKINQCENKGKNISSPL